MSSFGSFPTVTESFLRLEDFSTYSSCIRCFGKSIISPLLTPEQREEVCRFRNAAAKIEADNVKKKKECSSISDEVKAVNCKDSLSSCSNNDFALHSEDEEQNSALYAESMLEFPACQANDGTIFSNEMHISKCDISSTDICSTVHNNVIVSQKVGQDEEESLIWDTKRPTSCTDLDEVHMVVDNSECSLHQDGIQQDLNTWVPYESDQTEQMRSVSEDEPDSITESTEFGSLPTVINAKQFHPQDTDNESSITCLTQSTDLEKYLDSSIDYSSPDDLALSRSNNLNSSTRSDDASSETLVNTGSESTPCASAMAVLGCTYDAQSDVPPKKNDSEALINNSVVPRRSHSVDSYIKMAGICAKKPPFRKSQSEPSYNQSKNNSEINLTESKPPYIMLEDTVPKTEIGVGECQQEVTPVSDSEIDISFEPMAEGKKSLKRKHVRTNSYTLEHPSPALILAHADCNCGEDSPNLSPHSCSEGKVFHSPPNLAFKKEKVHIILPPASERDRYFPILNSTSVSVKKPDVDIIGDPKLSTDETKVQLPEAAFESLHESESKSIENSDIDSRVVGNSVEFSSKESLEEKSDVNKLYASTQDVNQQNKEIIMSSAMPSESKSEDIKEFVNQVIRDVKETQKIRLNQFFEQQNKLWLQMQEEFKEQEILICEKLKVVDISTFSAGVRPMPYEYSSVDMQQHSNINQNIPKTNTSEVLQLNRNSNPGNNYLSVETTDKEPSEVDSSQKSPESVSDTTNFKVAESSSESIHSSESVNSTENTRQDREIDSPIPNHSSSLLASNGTLQADSSDGYLAGSSMSSKSFSNSDRPFQNRTADVLSDGPDSMSEISVGGNIITSESRSQSSMSSKSFNNSNRRFQNHTLDVLSDRSEDQDSSKSETSVNNNLKASEANSLQSSVSSKSYCNSDRRFPNCTLNVLSDKPEGHHSNMSKASINVNYKSSEMSVGGNIHSPMQSLYDSCPISVLSVPYFSESNCSSISFRSSSNLSQISDVFHDSRFLKGNNCPACSSVGGPGVCVCQGHGGRESVCPECSSCLKCCSFEQRLISYEALSDGGDRHFTTPISPSEFIPHPSHLKNKKNSTSSSLPVQNHGVKTHTLSFTSNNIKSLDIKTSDTSNSDQCLYPTTMNSLPDQFHGISPTAPSFKNSNISSSPNLNSSETSNSNQYLYPIAMNSLPVQNNGISGSALSLTNSNISRSLNLNSSETSTSDQYPLLNNNLEPNIKQNVLIINTKNNLSEVNTPDDISYSEEEIRAINDLVQSSYTSSYSSPLNEGCLSNSSKTLSQEGGYKSSSHIPSNEKGALKQSIAISLTNLKRRQSRDIVKDPILLKKFEKLPALVKGYLTRRLFKTERVQDLIRTLKDTALLVGKFSQELKLKGNSVSENDVDLHRQLISQLMRTFDNVYDIFCTTSVKEQMKIISESRNFRMKKKTTEKNESSASVVSEKFRPSPSKKPKVSAATLKALERKRSSINSRTFTVEDFKSSRKPKVHSTSTTKSNVTSPARIYKSTIGTSIKRKTSVCKSSPWK